MSFTAQVQNLFFTSPEASVEIITQLLINEDWSTLSGYYHLDDRNEGLIDSLLSGDYFIRKEMPEVAHPGGFWKYKQPFSPGFTYSSHEQISNALIKVNLTIEIDQGDGMIQVGRESYLLKEFKEGFKLLPDQPREEPDIIY